MTKMSKHESAVKYIIRRVYNDPNFRHYMLFSEAFVDEPFFSIDYVREEVFAMIQDAECTGNDFDFLRLKRICGWEPVIL